MKKSFLLLITAVVVLNAAAVNRLYMPDFTISPGETMQVALILENDEQFTAFQTDLILPEGLSVVQEDDEYLLDLSGRNASDHTIISKLRDDGAIRMVSFSIGVKPYSGNNGALVVVNLIADEDFVAPATVTLKHSKLATTEGVEFILDGDTCQVTIVCDQPVKGDSDGNGTVSISDVTFIIDYLLSGCQTSFHTQNADMNNDGVVSIADATELIDMLLQGG